MTYWLRNGIIAPVLALYMRRLGISVANIGFLMMINMLGWAIFEPTFGILADKLGKKRLMIYSAITTSFIYISYTFASNIWHFYLIAFAMSSNSSAGSVSSRAMLAEILPSSGRGRVYGRYTAILSFGQILGPLLGGFITESIGYKMPFFISGGLSMVSLLAILPLKYHKEPRKESISSEFTLIDRNLMTRPFVSLLLIRLLYMFNMNFQRNILPIFLNENPRYTASETQIGFYMGVLRLTAAFSNLLLGDVSDRIGSKKLMFSSLFLGGLSYITLPLFQGVTPLYMLGAVQGIFFASANLSMMIFLMSILPSNSSGKAMGFYGLFEDIGGIVASASLGTVYEWISPMSSVLSVSGILMFDAVLSFLMIKKIKK